MKKEYVGSDFDDFLEADGIREEVVAPAIKRVIAWQVAVFMQNNISLKQKWQLVSIMN